MRHLLLALAFIAACASQGDTTNNKNNASPTAAAGSFGKAFEKKDVVQVSSVAKDAAPFLNKTIQLEGKVTAVCQNRGCWMELTDDATKTKVRITTSETFFVPKDSSGKTAVAEGVLSSKDVPQDEAAHLAAESNQPAPTGPVKELRLEATGVMIL